MMDETINPNTTPFLIFSLLNNTPLKNNSSEIGAIIIAENNSKTKTSVLSDPEAISNRGKEIEPMVFKTESRGNKRF